MSEKCRKKSAKHAIARHSLTLRLAVTEERIHKIELMDEFEELLGMRVQRVQNMLALPELFYV